MWPTARTLNMGVKSGYKQQCFRKDQSFSEKPVEKSNGETLESSESAASSSRSGLWFNNSFIDSRIPLHISLFFKAGSVGGRITNCNAWTPVRMFPFLIWSSCHFFSFFSDYPVSWGCRIHRLHLCRGLRHPQWVSWFDTKQSDGDVPMMLELTKIPSNP